MIIDTKKKHRGGEEQNNKRKKKKHTQKCTIPLAMGQATPIEDEPNHGTTERKTNSANGGFGDRVHDTHRVHGWNQLGLQ
ncbi:hypothetical protein, partial [Enterobacter cloacae]|uniref:hypothetical protein n=1 Tax=Enterobacter cloacae TaxID=550 RepID=UPI003D71D604